MMILILLSFSLFKSAESNCGSQRSELESKCLAYPSLSEYYKDRCYILEITSRKSRSDIHSSACQHLDGYIGKLATVDSAMERALTNVGILNNKYTVITQNRVIGGERGSDSYPYLCEYSDIISCKSSDFKLFGLHCYKVYTKARSWNEAAKMCAEKKGSLAVFHDDDTVQFVAKMAKDLGVDRFYIGLSWNSNQNKWVNSDRTTTDYFRWFGKAEGSETVASSVSENPFVYLYSEGTDGGQAGTFGYMGITKSGTRYGYACQELAESNFGNIIVPGSSLWTSKGYKDDL